MGSLAIDIETASPFEEPGRDENATRFYEWISIGMAYRKSRSHEPETAVFFRRGGWEPEHMADLFQRVIDWCNGRDIERTLTYNGDHFDMKHLLNWAEELEQSEEWDGFTDKVISSFPHHIDLAKAATEIHKDELQDGQPVIPDFIAYKAEDIDNDSIWYEDYNFHPNYWDKLGIKDKFVKGEHIGQVLGGKYVEGVEVGLKGTKTQGELKRLLYDYSISDIVDLFELYDSLGGERLDRDFHYPIRETEI